MATTNNGIPRIVRGNDFVLRAQITHAVLNSDGSTVQEEYDMTEASGISVAIVSRMGKRTQMSYTVEGSSLLIPFDETVASGLYGLEVTGKDASGGDWRFYAQPGEFIEIVEPTSSAYIPSTDTVAGYYSVSLNVGLLQMAGDLLKEMREATDKAEVVAGTTFKRVGNKMYLEQ